MEMTYRYTGEKVHPDKFLPVIQTKVTEELRAPPVPRAVSCADVVEASGPADRGTVLCVLDGTDSEWMCRRPRAELSVTLKRPWAVASHRAVLLTRRGVGMYLWANL